MNRYLTQGTAILAFGLDTAAQIHTLRLDSSRHSVTRYGPHPFSLFIALFLHTFLGVSWLKKLLPSPPSQLPVTVPDEAGPRGIESFQLAEEVVRGHHSRLKQWIQGLWRIPEPVRLDFLPLFVSGCLCQGEFHCSKFIRVATSHDAYAIISVVGWSLSWSSKSFLLCRFFIAINTSIQFYGIFGLLHSRRNHGLPKQNAVTHLIAKFRAAFSMLLLWKTWGVVDVSAHSSSHQRSNPRLDRGEPLQRLAI